MNLQLKNFSKPFELIILLVVPIILFLSSLKTIKERDKVWYGGGYDPEYAYLMNSLNMARLKLVGHFDHPGTTAQIAGGIILKVSWLIDKRGEDLTTAVLSEPEHYLRILNISSAAIGSLAIFLLSLLIFFTTGNFALALLFQATPFVSGFVLFNGFTRISQEVMQMTAALALSATALLWVNDNNRQTNDNHILRFAIISGFGMASKVLFAPLMIIPVVLLKGLRFKLRYILFSFIAFVIFTIPIIKLYPKMLFWFYKLFIHSGQYGQGETNVIDTNKYFIELVRLLEVNPVLAGLFFICVLILIFSITRRYFAKDDSSKAYIRLLAAALIAQAIGYLLVAKQPKEAYLLPYESITAINMSVIIYFIVSFFKLPIIKNILSVLLATAGLFLLINYGLKKKNAIYSVDKNKFWETSYKASLDAKKDGAVIYIEPSSSPMIGLYFGNAYSIQQYTEKLREIYPDVFIYESYSGKIYQWGGKEISLTSLLHYYNDQVVLFGQKLNIEVLQSHFTIPEEGIKFIEIYRDDKNVILTTEKNNNYSYSHLKNIFSSAEPPGSVYAKEISAHLIRFIGQIVKEYSYSGEYSVKADDFNPYAFTTHELQFEPGSVIIAKVMGRGDPENMRLIASNSADLYSSAGPNVKSKEDQWHEISLRLEVTDKIAELPVKFYAFRRNTGTVYFDNFELEVIAPVKETIE